MFAEQLHRYNVELANGQTLNVDICPQTGDPLIDGRTLPKGSMLPFSFEQPPRSPAESKLGQTLALRCG